MDADPFECPKCGSRMLNDPAVPGYRCHVCGNHEQFGHALDGGQGAGGAGAGAPMPESGPSTDGRTGPSQEGTWQGALDSEFRQPVIMSLASILRITYSGAKIRELFKSSGHPVIWDNIGENWKFLSGALERTQRECGPYGVARILETACAEQDELGNHRMRGDINECLLSCGVEIGEDCKARRIRRAGPPAGEAALFDQRRYHKAVIEHARPGFLRKDYFSSVVEGCKVLEELVRERSGIDDYGASLMKRALGDRGILEVDMADLTGRTRDGIRRGLGSMCEGIVSGVQNPASREYEQRFPISGEDALDILGVISYLCRQIEKMRRR